MYFIKNAKKGTSGGLFHRAIQNKVRLGIYFIENDEIRYGWGI